VGECSEFSGGMAYGGLAQISPGSDGVGE